MKSFGNCKMLNEMMFPDQDFLSTFFRNRWTPLPWKFNTRKTMRYWHQNIWHEEEVTCLHHIVDKPWTKRLEKDGNGNVIAGYKGRDGVMHGCWWWREFES